VVWNLIHDDIGVIEGQMKISENGHSSEVFKQRIDKLAVQYVHLKNALQSYANAMESSAGKGPTPPQSASSFWRKLLRL